MKEKPAFNRVCIWCNKVFVSEKTTTMYCSHTCNMRHYKQKEKEKRKGNNDVQVKAKVAEMELAPLLLKPYLSIKETCKFIGISRSTLHRHTQYGNIEFIAIGGRIFYTKDAINDFMESHSIKNTL